MRIRRQVKGQGMAEYALTLALVSLGAIVVLALVGAAVQRVFGVVVGGLGSRVETNASQIIFDPGQLPRCGYFGSDMVFYMKGFTNAAVSDLAVSFDIPLSGTISEDGPGVFSVMITVAADTKDFAVCPHSVVVQSSPDGNALMASPVQLRHWTE
ncbi:MAG TPA: hypothetical protein PLD47_16125 [Aggregatilineales bacterium]|nr:hypothetical protein [Anaerolineales bacterium]HRE49254.1 hypothetical protein [Aggregatilineales bacterium]